MENTIYSVSDINRYIKAKLTSDESLKYIYIKGEISNFKHAVTGHLYFSLKDKDSLINAIMFNNYALKNVDTFDNGDEVIVLASIDAYVARGSYNLIVYEMNKSGKGAKLLALEKLKKQLASEGLFDISHKRNINLYPKAIGIITAKNSAAIKDLTFNISRRYPLAKIYFFPSSVQGENATKELVLALRVAYTYPLDTLIIGRGGGANEDLDAFNDEEVVRTAYNSPIPIIAAIGHEIDSTLLDYVADKRASTPTGAAELATIDIRELLEKINNYKSNIFNNINQRLIDIDEYLKNYNNNFVKILKNKIANYELRLSREIKRLDALNPNNVLKRGYAFIEKEDKVISDINDVKIADIINIRLNNGQIKAEVKGVKSNG